MKKLLVLIVSIFLLGFSNKPLKQRIFLIGDSTMANKLPIDAPETGWGQVFNKLFIDAVEIHNYAVNGRSSKSFRSLGHWQNVYSQLNAGDYVFIQFGHNDQKKDDTLRFAAARTDYRSNLERYIHEVQSKGAIPILLTPVSRRKFDESGKFVDQHGDYPIVMREIAKEKRITLIDMTALSQKTLEEIGENDSRKIFMHFVAGVFPKFPKGIEDNTHFSPYGAALMANLVAQDLVKQVHPLRNLLKDSELPTIKKYQLPVISEPYFRKDTFNIVQYGAKSNGVFLNTRAITQAIDMANAAGGGTVLIPSGVWLTGPLKLKSNVNLHLSTGALLQFSNNRDDYPIVETTWEGQKSLRCQAPIWAVGLENIGITGNGIMDGSGEVWKMIKSNKVTNSQWKKLLESGGVLNKKGDTWYPTEQSRYGNEDVKEWANLWAEGKTLEDYETVRDFLRPNMISITECKNVLIDGVTFQNSPAWTLHPLLTKHITIRNVNVRNPWFGQNNDALDLESCQYGLVEGCTFDTGDDAITIKSGRDEQGRQRGVPTENIIVRNTTVFHAHGGFVIGSEMSGGVRNLYVYNCSFLGTDIGLRFKTKRDRGGVVENIYIADIAMNHIPGEAILFDMYYEAKDPIALEGDKVDLPEIKAEPVNEGTPQFKNFFITNVNCFGAETAIVLRGLPEMNIKNINIENSNFTSNKGLVCIEADNISFKNVGFFTKSSKVIQVQNSKNILLDRIQYANDRTDLIEINGERSDKIRLVNTDIKFAKNTVLFTNKAKKNSFYVK